MRKKDNNLQHIILDMAREMANTSGPESINIRTIAKRSGIAIGTVYNYFSSKDDILLALTEESWRNALLEMHDAITAENFCDQLEEIYLFLSSHLHQSAGKLMGSLHNVEIIGRQQMQSMQQELGAMLTKRIDADDSIRKDIWNDIFTKEQYTRFIIMNIMLLLQMKSQDIQFFCQIIKRTLY